MVFSSSIGGSWRDRYYARRASRGSWRFSSCARPCHPARLKPIQNFAFTKAQPAPNLESGDLSGLSPVDDRAGREAEVLGKLGRGEKALAHAFVALAESSRSRGVVASSWRGVTRPLFGIHSKFTHLMTDG
jgi:hypothetical protein